MQPQSLIESHEERIASLEAGQRELLPAMAKVSAQVEAVAATVARIDAKLDAGAQALEDHKVEDAVTKLDVHDLKAESERKGKLFANIQYGLWTAVAGVLADLVIHVLEHLK